MTPFINTFSRHYKDKYGMPVGKIALYAGHVCPNREKGGCIYCSAESFTPFYLEKNDSIADQLKKGKAYLAEKKFRRYFSYFQQETTTAVPLHELLPMLRYAVSDQDCRGLIISTRPDYIDEELLAGLAGLRGTATEILLELGLQSAHDRTLRFLNRNHTCQDFVDAVSRIRKFKKIELGVHLILGLPGETSDDMLQTVNKVCGLGVDYLKFHHLQVIRNTPLEKLYRTKPFRTYAPEEYLEILARLIAHIPEHIVLHRLWSTADPKLLVAPHWKMFSYELHSLLLQIMTNHQLYQGKLAHHEHA